MPSRGAKTRMAGVVEAFQDLRGGKSGHHLARRLVEREAAFLDKLHGGGGGDRLGHGGDAEHRHHVHRRRLDEAATPERALVDHSVGRGGDRHDARHRVLLHRLT